MWNEQRFGDPIVFGIQGGLYIAETVRVVLRFEMPSKNATDEFRFDYDYNSGSTPYHPTDSTAATLLYGGALGFVAAASDGFVFAPGVVFQRSDVSDYGSMVGVAIPFEWVTTRGLRFGLEVNLGRAFGGTVHYACSDTGGAGCESPTWEGNRGAGRAFAIRFQMGFGFNRSR